MTNCVWKIFILIAKSFQLFLSAALHLLSFSLTGPFLAGFTALFPCEFSAGFSGLFVSGNVVRARLVVPLHAALFTAESEFLVLHSVPVRTSGERDKKKLRTMLLRLQNLLYQCQITKPMLYPIWSQLQHRITLHSCSLPTYEETTLSPVYLKFVFRAPWKKANLFIHLILLLTPSYQICRQGQPVSSFRHPFCRHLKSRLNRSFPSGIFWPETKLWGTFKLRPISILLLD